MPRNVFLSGLSATMAAVTIPPADVRVGLPYSGNGRIITGITHRPDQGADVYLLDFEGGVTGQYVDFGYLRIPALADSDPGTIAAREQLAEIERTWDQYLADIKAARDAQPVGSHLWGVLDAQLRDYTARRAAGAQLAPGARFSAGVGIATADDVAIVANPDGSIGRVGPIANAADCGCSHQGQDNDGTLQDYVPPDTRGGVGLIPTSRDVPRVAQVAQVTVSRAADGDGEPEGHGWVWWLLVAAAAYVGVSILTGGES